MYECPGSAHTDHIMHIGTDRGLLTGHDALLLQQIARDLLHALSQRHDNTWHGLCWTNWRHWLEQVGDSQLECELLTWSKQTKCMWLKALSFWKDRRPYLPELSRWLTSLQPYFLDSHVFIPCLTKMLFFRYVVQNSLSSYVQYMTVHTFPLTCFVKHLAFRKWSFDTGGMEYYPWSKRFSSRRSNFPLQTTILCTIFF